MITKQEYVESQINLCKENDIRYKSLIGNFEQEWFELLLEELKKGNKITKEIFDSLDSMQQYYINKHYIIHGQKIY